MADRAYYSAEISDFLKSLPETIIGQLTKQHSQELVYQQTSAWNFQIEILQRELKKFENGYICFELLIPRMGKRADVVCIIEGIVFVLEFKTGERQYKAQDIRQTQSYALDLSYFHEASHDRLIVPILIATEGTEIFSTADTNESGVISTLKANKNNIGSLIQNCISIFPQQYPIIPKDWLMAQYKPTPTIIEAAQALYSNHNVADIARSDAGAINITETSNRLNEIIHHSRLNQKKTICFVTGVPGAGKTLVGLQIATTHNNPDDEEYAVFLSGNGPLVDVLREALARDKIKQSTTVTIGTARRETASFIQNIHHFRDEALKDKQQAPIEKIVIFDEAQRAWNKNKASYFMQRKRNEKNFNESEPEFLISVMDRHQDWCVIIALIGGGQEINDGEAGLNGWLSALAEKFPNWNIYYSEKLKQKEYSGNDINLDIIKNRDAVSQSSLHLQTSMRSFRAEKLSHLVHHIIHNQSAEANALSHQIIKNYPIFITRDLIKAKKWIKNIVKGLETSGIIASSGAKRLKADGIFINTSIQVEDWFLNSCDDVRSCHFLEDAATEFVIQGLELDWCIVAWDADFRFIKDKFEHWKFSGTKWMRRKQIDQQRYLENSYRVLLTRARQGMIIYVPLGDESDCTRDPEFYNGTYNFLIRCGLQCL